MHIYLYILLLITFIFPNTVPLDTNLIIVPEVEIYGGLNESSTSTNISIIKEDEFHLNGNNSFEDLLQTVGNLHYAGGTSRARYFQLRGLGELSQFSGEGAPPSLTDEIRITLAERYIELYNQLTRKEFNPIVGDVKTRIEINLEKAGIYA